MSLRSTVRRLLVALCATAAGGAALAAPQAAVAAPTPSLAAPAETSGSVVQGLTFPGDAGFAYAGCYGWDGGVAPQALVRDIPGSPNGNRSTGFTTSAGTGAGPQAAVPSLRNIGPMDISVWSEGGASGFAYVWLFPAKGGAFLGTTRLGTGAGWSTSDAASATFTWTERDRTTFAPVVASTRGGSLSLSQAAARFGNGPARVGFAFGCGGEDFSLDRFRVGTRSFDFEGIAVQTSMTRLRRNAAGETVLVGRSTGAGSETGEPLVLQASQRQRAFRDVAGADVTVDARGVHRAAVKPAVDTTYRWRRVEVSYAEGGLSRTVVVPGQRTGAQQEKRKGQRPGAEPGRPEATQPPTEEPTEPETEQPTEPTVPDPTEPPTEEPTQPETEQPTEPTEPAVPDPTEPPTQEPSPEPTPEPTPEAPVACEGLTYEDTAVWLEAQGLDASAITSTLDEDCPTADDLDAMAAELGIVLELVPGIQG